MAPSPMGYKAYQVWRMFQAEQAKRHPEKAEAIWTELIVVLVLAREAAKKWDGPKHSPLPLYQRGSIWEATSGFDPEEIARIIQEYDLILGEPVDEDKLR